jgi:small subunit ribosomal protein S5
MYAPNNSSNNRGRGGERAPQEFDEKVIRISRVSKKTKGGNKASFTALVVVGDRKGRVGVALGKAKDVMNAIKKGVRKGKKNLIQVPLIDNRTIPHVCVVKFGAARLILKPAPAGTGVIAGGSVRAVLELAGVHDVVAKILGTNNKMSNVAATFDALKIMKSTMNVKEALGQTNVKKVAVKTITSNTIIK